MSKVQLFTFKSNSKKKEKDILIFNTLAALKGKLVIFEPDVGRGTEWSGWRGVISPATTFTSNRRRRKT